MLPPRLVAPHLMVDLVDASCRRHVSCNYGRKLIPEQKLEKFMAGPNFDWNEKVVGTKFRRNK
jgi:hypothetical protein